MSAQTGRPSLAPPPPESRNLERARIRALRLRNDPNPVWMRELKQAARLNRTPIILATITALISLMMCSIGGAASINTEPAKVGVALFHTFFSVAFAVVTWIAPAVAASTIASERSGRTWEALLLTGLGAPSVARGKFLAALTYIALYIVMLVPVGALPFLFGGVTATEVITAFALLGLFAVLSVAFGLSISSKLSSQAAAIVVTLLVAIPLSLFGYGLLGPGLSVAAHDVWSSVPEGPPVWLPTAYVRAEFGMEYLAFLVVLPIAATIVPAWFFYEVTVANMRSLSEDRSSRLKWWYALCGGGLTLAAVVPCFAVPSNDAWGAALVGMGSLGLYHLFGLFVFAGEPLAPSRRVRVQWDRVGRSKFRRFMGPGLMKTSSLMLMSALPQFSLLAAVGVAFALIDTSSTRFDVYRVLSFAAYLGTFYIFLVGFTSWSRARARGGTSPRLMLVLALFLAVVGPWIIMAIAGVVTSDPNQALIVGAPSPAYIFVMMDELRPSGNEIHVAAGYVCAMAWGLVGLGALGMASARAKKEIDKHHASEREVEKLLNDEDAARAEAAQRAAAEAEAMADAPPPAEARFAAAQPDADPTSAPASPAQPTTQLMEPLEDGPASFVPPSQDGRPSAGADETSGPSTMRGVAPTSGDRPGAQAVPSTLHGVAPPAAGSVQPPAAASVPGTAEHPRHSDPVPGTLHGVAPPANPPDEDSS